MLTKTSLSAVRALTFLGLNRREQPWSPRSMAQHLGESPTYLAKVVRHLVRAGILKAHRGVSGGVALNREPGEITLLAIAEACQGAILGDFCSDASLLSHACAFHQAGAELHRAIVDVLSRWSLADFLAKPDATGPLAGNTHCWLSPCPRLQSLAGPPTSSNGVSTPRERVRRHADTAGRRR
jgi:Rrf2 family protein